MVTIIRNPITYLAPKFGTLVIMILALWYFRNNCPNCICYDRVCSDCICPDLSCPSITESICMVTRPSMVVIQPCYIGGMDISDVRKIDRDFLDSKNVGRSPTLIITVPVNIQFDNSYLRVVFSGYARQYYFPNIHDRFSYVIAYDPIKYVRKLGQNNVTRCESEKHYYIYDNEERAMTGTGAYLTNSCILKS